MTRSEAPVSPRAVRSERRRCRLDLATGALSSVQLAPEAPPSLAALEHLAAEVGSGESGASDADVVLSAGELAGTGLPGTARVALLGISLRTRRVAESRCAGPFGGALRAAGLDLLALSGRAVRPSYVLVEAGVPRLLPAEDIWDLPPREAAAWLHSRHGTQTQSAVIGAAGIRGLGHAAVLAGGDHLLTGSGLGGVLGRKRVKAIVVVSGQAPRARDPQAVERISQEFAKELRTNPLARSQHEPPGFAAYVTTDLFPGHLSRANFRDTTTAGPSLTGAPDDGLLPAHLSGAGECPGCPVDCLKSFRTGADQVVLHQEWLPSLGPGVGLSSLPEALAAVRVCLDFGMDPVAVGGALAVAREGGADQPLEELLHAAAGLAPAGVPADLAAALATGADAVGDLLGAPAMTVRGQELPTFDLRVQAGLALACAVAPAGPRYDLCEHDLDFDPQHGMPHSEPEARRLGLGPTAPADQLDAARVERTARLMLLWSGLDALDVCQFAATPTRPLTLEAVTGTVRAGSGRALTAGDVFELGRARFEMQDRINSTLGGEGWARALPDRLHDEPIRSGPFAGARLHRDTFAAATDQLAASIGLAAPSERIPT